MQDTRFKIQVRRLLCLGLVGVLFGVPPAATAADEPVSIRAADVELNQKTGVATYRGHVLMTQGNMTLTADWLEATLKDQNVEFVRATGAPASASQGGPGSDTTTVTASRMLYRTGTRTLDLTDGVTLRRGADVMRGSAGHCDFNSGRFEVRGNPVYGDRVSAVIQPRPETPAP